MKEDVLYLSAYLFTEFFNYILAYVVVFNASLRRIKKVWILMVSVLFIVHILILQYMGVEDASAVSETVKNFV